MILMMIMMMMIAMITTTAAMMMILHAEKADLHVFRSIAAKFQQDKAF